MKMGKTTLIVTELNDASIDGENSYKGFKFAFHIPAYTVHAGGRYFNFWSYEERMRAHERARQESQPEVTKSFKIFPEAKLEGKSVGRYLAANPQTNLLVLAAEILAQSIFLGEINIPRYPNTENTALDVLYGYMWNRGIWLKQPVPWFHLNRETGLLFCPQLSCRQLEVGTEVYDPFCPKCGKRRVVYHPPILCESFYSCLNSQCACYRKSFDINHKRCHECGGPLSYLWLGTQYIR